jgi:hypothetical protein
MSEWRQLLIIILAGSALAIIFHWSACEVYDGGCRLRFAVAASNW